MAGRGSAGRELSTGLVARLTRSRCLFFADLEGVSTGKLASALAPDEKKAEPFPALGVLRWVRSIREDLTTAHSGLSRGVLFVVLIIFRNGLISFLSVGLQSCGRVKVCGLKLLRSLINYYGSSVGLSLGILEPCERLKDQDKQLPAGPTRCKSG